MNFKSRRIDLHVIDAPSLRYGRLGCSEAVALQYRLQETSIRVFSHIAWDEPSLRAVLRNIKSFRKTYRHPRRALPFIHIAAGHGNPDGLLIGDSVPIGWHVLEQMLSGVNALTDHNLLLGLSSCHGLFGYRMACIAEQKPFHLLVGPRRKRSTKLLVEAFARFYRSLLSDYSSIRHANIHANQLLKGKGPVLEYTFGWEVKRWFEKLGIDDPRKLTKRRRRKGKARGSAKRLP
jgi:hypothetical protein